MKYLLSLLICTTLLGAPYVRDESQARGSGYRYADNEVRQYKQKRAILRKSHLAIDGMIHIAYYELYRRGYRSEASEIYRQWRGTYSRYLSKYYYGIGDFEPLSKWLSMTYVTLEMLLGIDTMRFLHLDDLYVMNHTLPVVFAPCPADGDRTKQDFMDHFVGDSRYNGFAGTATFWGSYFSCMVGTWGSGWMWLCGVAGEAGEYGMTRWVAPGVGNMVYDLFCGG